MVAFERAMVVSYRLSIVTIALPFGHNLPSNVSDARVNGGSGSLWQKLGTKGSTYVSQTLARSGRGMRLSYTKNRVDIFSRLSTMHERDRHILVHDLDLSYAFLVASCKLLTRPEVHW